MSENIGTPSAAHNLLSEYYPHLGSELMTDDTNALLGAVLMELRTDRLSGGGPQSLGVFTTEQEQEAKTGGESKARADYSSTSASIDESEWTPVDLGTIAGEIDLRNFSAGIRAAFADPAKSGDSVPYGSDEEPVVGIPARTSKVWLRSQDGAGSQSVQVDAWGDA